MVITILVVAFMELVAEAALAVLDKQAHQLMMAQEESEQLLD